MCDYIRLRVVVRVAPNGVVLGGHVLVVHRLVRQRSDLHAERGAVVSDNDVVALEVLAICTPADAVPRKCSRGCPVIGVVVERVHDQVIVRVGADVVGTRPPVLGYVAPPARDDLVQNGIGRGNPNRVVRRYRPLPLLGIEMPCGERRAKCGG